MKVIGLILTAMVIALLMGLLFAWPIMIALGIAHGFDARVPAYGFWTTLFLASAIKMATGVDTD